MIYYYSYYNCKVSLYQDIKIFRTGTIYIYCRGQKQAGCLSKIESFIKDDY